MTTKRSSILCRLVWSVSATSLLVTFCVAFTLQPDAAGLGTHQQLGLPPCTFVLIWDIRCPMCGMTTSWTHLVQGRLVAALRASPGGVALAFAGVAILACNYRMIRDGRWPSRRQINGWTWVLVSVVVLILADWIYRVFL